MNRNCHDPLNVAHASWLQNKIGLFIYNVVSIRSTHLKWNDIRKEHILYLRSGVLKQSVCTDNSHSTGMLSGNPVNATDWRNKGHAMCYHVNVIMHAKDPLLSVVKVRHCVIAESLCLN